MLSSVDELHEYVDKDSLPSSVGGTVDFDQSVWLSYQRVCLLTCWPLTHATELYMEPNPTPVTLAIPLCHYTVLSQRTQTHKSTFAWRSHNYITVQQEIEQTPWRYSSFWDED